MNYTFNFYDITFLITFMFKPTENLYTNMIVNIIIQL